MKIDELYDKKLTNSISFGVFYGILYALILLILIFLLKPIFFALGLTVVQVYVFYPSVDYVFERVKSRLIAIGVISVFFLVPFFMISAFFVSAVAAQLMELTRVEELKPVVELLGVTFKEIMTPSIETLSIATFTQSYGAIIDFLQTVSMWLLQILLASFFTAYVLYKEDKIIEAYRSISDRKIKDFILFVDKALQQVVYSMFVTAFVTGVVAILVYALFGVPFAVLLGALTGIVALIPFLGNWLVYLPMAIYFILVGQTYFGLAFLVVSIVFISVATDVVVRPFVAGRAEHIDVGLLLIGFVTGTLAFGPVGMILGPLIIISLVGYKRTYLDR